MTKKQDDFQHAMNQGHSAAWDQSWNKAADFYRQALKIVPGNPQALSNLGLALVELQEFEEALRCYLEAARALPEDPLPLEKVAQLSERMGEIEKASQASLRAAELYLKNRDVPMALQSWGRVVRLNPENLQARTRLALVYERMGEKRNAVAQYLVAASLYQAGGDLGKARQAVDQALRILPNNEDAIQALSLLKDYKQLPKPSRSRSGTAPLSKSQVHKLPAPKAETQPDLDPVTQASQKALTVLAGVLFEGMDEERDGLLERKDLTAIVTGTGALHKPIDRSRMMLHLSQMVDYQSKGEYAQAAEELQRSIDVGLEHPAAFFDLGFLHMKTGRLESAIRQLQHSIQHVDFALATRLLLGDLLRKKGQIGEASIEYLQALELADAQLVTPEQANDLMQLYELIIESHRKQSDIEAQARLCDNIQGMLVRDDWRSNLRQARKQMPGSVRNSPPIPLAELLMEASSGKVIEAISLINRLTDKGYFDSAMEEAYYALEHAPTYLPLHSIMGEILQKGGDQQGAMEKFGTVARLYSLRGDMQLSIAFSSKVVELAPTDLTARMHLIDQLIAFGKVEKAIEEYMQLAEVYNSLADLTMARKTYNECLRLVQQTNADRSLRIKILKHMADIDLQNLDWHQALRVLDQISTLQPDDEETRFNLIQLNIRLEQEQQALTELDNYLAYLSSKKLESNGQAFLEGLINEFPDNVPMRRRLADLYRKLGHTVEAVDQLDAIGKILLDAGDRAAAIQTVEIILSIDPPNKAEYQEVLDQLRREQGMV